MFFIVLACSSGPHCPIRHPHPIVSDINTQYVNLPFMVGLPTPKEFPEVVIREEMRTYHLLW